MPLMQAVVEHSILAQCCLLLLIFITFLLLFYFHFYCMLHRIVRSQLYYKTQKISVVHLSGLIICSLTISQSKAIT